MSVLMLVTSQDHLPLSLVTLEGDVTTEDVQALGAYYRALNARAQRYATLLDVRRVSVPNAATRRALAEMTNEFAGEERYTVCIALILDSTVLVGVLRAVQWFLRTKSETRSFASSVEAYGYLTDKLAKEGLVIPPGARAALDAMR